MRNIEEANIQMLVQLLEKITSGIDSMVNDYTNLYNQEELVLLENTSKLINNQLEKINSGNYNKEQVK